MTKGLKARTISRRTNTCHGTGIQPSLFMRMTWGCRPMLVSHRAVGAEDFSSKDLSQFQDTAQIAESDHGYAALRLRVSLISPRDEPPEAPARFPPVTPNQ